MFFANVSAIHADITPMRQITMSYLDQAIAFARANIGECFAGAFLLYFALWAIWGYRASLRIHKR